MDRRTFCVALALLSPVACNRVPPLADTYSSPNELAAAVLDALASGDRARLEALALSEQEFRDHVWPDLPAARPERNLPFFYVWGDLHQKSETALSQTLREHGTRRYELRRVTFDGVTEYARYRVHRGATLHVSGTSGSEIPLRVCGSMIEKDGAWKVFSYVVE